MRGGAAWSWTAGELAGTLAARLALGHRVLEPLGPAAGPAEAVASVEHDASEIPGRGARFDWLGTPPKDAEALRDRLVAGYRSAGGRLRLTRPEVEFLLLFHAGRLSVARRLADVDRRSFSARRMPKLPFQRPVSLPPRLARAAVNLSRVRPGELVVDPFVGTGAMLLEAALLGARVVGVDRDPRMVQGALRNFAAFDRSPESLSAEDGESAAARFRPGSVDALVTDPPYGRASSTRGEAADSLAARVLSAWAPTLRPDGRIVAVVPAGSADPLGTPWVRAIAIPHRVHRSLTREFRVYQRRQAP